MRFLVEQPTNQRNHSHEEEEEEEEGAGFMEEKNKNDKNRREQLSSAPADCDGNGIPGGERERPGNSKNEHRDWRTVTGLQAPVFRGGGRSLVEMTEEPEAEETKEIWRGRRIKRKEERRLARLGSVAMLGWPLVNPRH